MVTRPSQDASSEAAETSKTTFKTPGVAIQADAGDKTPTPQADAAEAFLPAAIIAQAESAIAGNIENDEMPPAERRAPRATTRQNAPKLKYVSIASSESYTDGLPAQNKELLPRRVEHPSS